MRAVVTRVTSASVTIDGKVNGAIGRGFLVLLGIGPNDTPAQAARLADKVVGLRVFEDENEKMNLNLSAVKGELLVVSQFTLYADTKSRRPGFTGAAKRILPFPSMRNSCVSALLWASRPSTGSSALIWRWPR